MKLRELFDKGNTTFKLTITPTRITIKLQKDISIELKLRVLYFFDNIVKEDSMVNCTQSFRGSFKLPKDKSIKWQIQMSTNNPNTKHTITFKELDYENTN
jgi:hypothetical protein